MIKTIPKLIDQSLLASDSSNWPTQGSWAYKDFLRLPEDGNRYEIIRGTLYMSPAPSFAHQNAISNLCFHLKAFTRPNKLGLVLVAPFEIHFDEDTRPVQPDIVYIPKDKISSSAKYYEGSPELVVEVLSPSSRRYDMSIKLDIYEQFGVREHWIVDPKFHSITIYYLPENGTEYILAGEFSKQETISSQLLEGFSLPVESIFLAE